MRWIALLLAGTAWAADTVLPELVPPDTKLVIGLQMRRILDSPLGKSLSADAGAAAGTTFGGVNILKDIDQVVVATNGGGQNAPSLFVLTGRFHVKPETSYHGVPVLAIPQHADQILAILDDSTALAGDLSLVHAAIDRRGTGSSAPTELLKRVVDMSERYDFWGIAIHLPKSPQPSQMDAVDGFSFGAALRQGLELTAEIHLRSTADTEKMTEWLKMIEAMVKTQSTATKFHFESRGGTLQLGLEIPEAELKKGIEAQKAAIASAIMSQMQMAKPATIEKPKAAGKIVTDSNGDTVSVTLPGGRNR